MKRTITHFWEEAPGVRSSKRLIQLVLTAFVVIISTVYLVVKWDYVGFIAIFGSISAFIGTLMGVGLKQENDRARIEMMNKKSTD